MLLVIVELVFGAIIWRMAFRNYAAGNTHNMIWNLIIGGAMFLSAGIWLWRLFKQR